MYKKISFFFSILIAVFLLFYACDSPPVFAETQAEQSSIVEDAGSLLVNYFATIPGLAAFVLFITGYIKKKYELTGQVVIFVSFIIALILSTGGYFFNLGIFVGVGWYYIFIYGLASCLIANGLADWNIIKSLLVFLKLRTGTVIIFLILFLSLMSLDNTINDLNERNKKITKKNITERLCAVNMTFLN